MNGVVRALLRVGTRVAVGVYRATGGRVGGTARGRTKVLLLTVPGRRTGVAHTTPVSYVEDDGRWVVSGTAGGAKQDPQWFRNLRATDRAVVELGRRRVEVSVEVPPEAERERLWREVVLARAPAFAGYESKAGRPIPVAVLTAR